VEDTEAAGFRRIAFHDLDRWPDPLPDADSRHAAKLDLSTGAVEGDPRPGLGDARAVRAVRTQHVGEDGNRVVALEGDE
jgi:hypothetical protein